MYGVPEAIVADNGLEFHGVDLASIAFDLGIVIQYCGKRQPWRKGAIERYLKTINYFFAHTPPAIREIHDACARARLEELERQADPNSKELAEARRYARENQELKGTIERLQNDLAMASARAESAEHALAQLKSSPLGGDKPSEVGLETDELVPGDVRFFKKTHSKGAYDVLVPVENCGHTSWQASNKADKAKKGLERILGRSDWKTLQHCGTCTGGGMWKDRW